MILASVKFVTLLSTFGILFASLVASLYQGTATAANESASESPMSCPSGRAAARLTGWTLNEKTPVGRAEYDESAKSLEVTVESVALPDGTRLAVFIGEEKIGDMEPLKQGVATFVVSKTLADGAAVLVFDADRPIVSANLQCVKNGPKTTSKPTPPRSPMPSPTSSPSPSPGPTAEPTPDPMPKRSPVPTPSPL